MAPGLEGTPWISAELERAGYSDRPYGWIVTVRTPQVLVCRPCMTFADALLATDELLNTAARQLVPVSLSKAEPLPPARRLAQ